MSTAQPAAAAAKPDQGSPTKAGPSTAAPSSSGGKAAPEDPWHDLESEVDVAMRAVNNAREQFRQAQDKIGVGAGTGPGTKDWSHVSASAAQQVDGLLSTLAQQIAAVEPDVQVMQSSIQAALDHPEKYNVATVELQRRHDVVQSVTRRLAKAKSDVAHGMRLREKRKAAQADSAARSEVANGAGTTGGNLAGYMDQEMEAQRDLRVDHDQTLDRLGAGVKSAEEKARTINRELDDQNRALTDVEHDMDGVQIKIDSSMARIGVLLDQSSDKGKIGIIVCLMIVLAILVVFLFTANDDASASASSS
jgi:chromosome segregation ATPase